MWLQEDCVGSWPQSEVGFGRLSQMSTYNLNLQLDLLGLKKVGEYCYLLDHIILSYLRLCPPGLKAEKYQSSLSPHTPPRLYSHPWPRITQVNKFLLHPRAPSQGEEDCGAGGVRPLTHPDRDLSVWNGESECWNKTKCSNLSGKHP